MEKEKKRGENMLTKEHASSITLERAYNLKI